MIFVTVGTNEAPFDRLLEGVAELGLSEELVVQTGASRIQPWNARCIDFLPFDEMTTNIRRARVIITHAGVGSIIVALANGKKPIVMPRLRRFGEAVDDHQVALAERLSQRGLVTAVFEPALLGAALVTIETDEPATIRLGAASQLADELRIHIGNIVDAAGVR